MSFKTLPFKHQEEEFFRSRSFPSRAIFWEQGTGKTWLALNTAAHLVGEGAIDACLVLAPNGVHRNWVSDEIPAHWPDDVPIQTFIWRSDRAATKWHREAAARALAGEAFLFVAMSYDAFMTKAGREFAGRVLEKRRCLYVLDESARIKSPAAKRTRAVVASGAKAPYRRILTGTPVANSPFDVYSQIKFLDENYWRTRGFASFEPFKTHFGVWVTRMLGRDGRYTDDPEKACKRFEQNVDYKNLDELHRYVAEIGSRVTKDDVLDLPPKLYSKRYFALSSEQRRLYDSIRDDMVAWLDSGEMVSAPLVIVRLLRLQQITCGYLPADDLEVVHEVPGANPRLDLLLETVEDLPTQAIVWARFRRDVDKICEALGDECVRYDGQVDDEDREIAKRRFQDGSAKFFVGNPACCGEGLTLTAAKTEIYYSNSFNLSQRLQSEDRAHRIGQTSPVSIVDLVGEDTVDQHIVKRLVAKNEFASKITGDEVRSWL